MKRPVYYFVVLLLLLVVQAMQAKDLALKQDVLLAEGEKELLDDEIKKENELNVDENSQTRRAANDRYSLKKMSRTIDELDRALTNNFPADKEELKHPRQQLANMKKDWDSKSYKERMNCATAVSSALSNIPKLGNAKDHPAEAVQGVLSIISSVSQIAGPTGQIINVGLMFVSSLLSLFGLGKKPKPIGEIVREEIDEALAKFHDKLISNEANAASFTLASSKAFLNAIAKKTDKLTNHEVYTVTASVPAVHGIQIMGKLADSILKLVKGNNPDDAERCFKYIELYFQLFTIKDMIMLQMIGLINEKFPYTIYGYLGVRQYLKDNTRMLVKFLHDPNVKSALMPYFDGEKYPVTEKYMTDVLRVKRPNRYPGPGYCITAFKKGKDYLGKSLVSIPSRNKENEWFPVAQVSNTAYCGWKLLSHGNDLYSIVSKDGMLSYLHDRGEPIVVFSKNNPALWEMKSNRIKLKYFCGNRCNYGLSYKWHKAGFLRYLRVYLVPQNNKMTIWLVYKSPSRDVAYDNDQMSFVSSAGDDVLHKEQDSRRKKGKETPSEDGREDEDILITEGQSDWYSRVSKRTGHVVN